MAQFELFTDLINYIRKEMLPEQMNIINISFDDIKKAFLPTLRHRLILNFQADTDNVTSDDVLLEIITTK